MLLRRRPRRAAAPVGLLAGLALLLGVVVDGGMASPTRAESLDGVSAVRNGEVDAGPTRAREDHPAWSAPALPIPPGALPATAATAALLVTAVTAVAALTALVDRAGPGPRAPARPAVRHRGPPSVV